MPSYRQVKNLIDPPNFKDNLILKNQNTKDIISEMVKSYNLYSDQGRPLVNIFKSKTAYNTARKIHSFLRNNFKYEIEPDEMQTSKSLNRYIYDRIGDCKHYSLAIASMMKGNPQFNRIFFRFVSYSPFKSDYHHVYVVAETNEGELIAIDPLQDFNYEKKYYYKLDKELKKSLNLENMSLSRLSGVGDCNGAIHGLFGKILAAPSRNAFLLLVKLNPLNIGGRTYDAYKTDASKLKAWWESIGGSWASLEKAIQTLTVYKNEQIAQGGGGDPFHLIDYPVGSDKRDQHCKDKYNWLGTNRGKCNSGKIFGIGAAAEGGAAALLVAAAPVIIGLTALIKSLGISKPSDSEFSNPAQQTMNQNPQNYNAGGSDIMKYALPLVIGGAALLLFLKK